jgi:hypothetical protein
VARSLASSSASYPRLFPTRPMSTVNFIGVHPARRGEGVECLLKDRVIFTKDLQSCDAEHWA